MTTNPQKDGAAPGESGLVTRGMVRDRAVELALSDGRVAQDVSKADWDQARRELTGDLGQDPLHSRENDDGAGPIESEKLVEEGLAETEHDLMLHAAERQLEDQ